MGRSDGENVGHAAGAFRAPAQHVGRDKIHRRSAAMPAATRPALDHHEREPPWTAYSPSYTFFDAKQCR